MTVVPKTIFFSACGLELLRISLNPYGPRFGTHRANGVIPADCFDVSPIRADFHLGVETVPQLKHAFSQSMRFAKI